MPLDQQKDESDEAEGVPKIDAKDMLGRKLEIGDTVAYAAVRGSTAFVRIGKIVSFNGRGVQLKISNAGLYPLSKRVMDGKSPVTLLSPERALKITLPAEGATVAAAAAGNAGEK